MEICKSKEGYVGIKFYNGTLISVVEGSIKELVPEKCISVDLKIHKDKAVFKGLTIPLYFKDDRLNYLRLLYILMGKTSNEVFYYNTAEIHLDTKLTDVKLSDDVSFTRFCGNYGLLFPQYCMGNETFAIFGRYKEDVVKAYEVLKGFMEVIRKVLLDLA